MFDVILTPISGRTDEATILFLLFIGYAIFRAYKFPENKEKYAQRAVILGILGTFVGIFLGLLQFDPKAIDTSIELLLDGLKTAFLTSIFGQVASLWINWKIKAPKVEGGVARDEIDMSDLRDALISIEKSIAGEGDTTLITQIKNFRTDNGDNLKNLQKSFEVFAEKMAENNSKALIEALENVMKDFNAKINEQFGDNFKQLNEAVGRMLIWQEEYKEFVQTTSNELRDTTEIIKTSVLSLNETKKVLNLVVDKTSVFQESAEKLDGLLASSNSALNSLNEVSRNSQNIFPNLENNIKSISENLNTALNDVSREISQQNQRVTGVYSEMQGQIHNLVKQTSSELEKQVLRLDQELGEELNKALESLGSQLVSLSSKFVNDYTPLTDKLQNIVDMSRRIN